MHSAARGQQKIKQGIYAGILNNLDALFVGADAPHAVAEFVKLKRQVWVYSSDEVVRAANAFRDAEDKNSAMQDLVLAMRRDGNTLEILPFIRVQWPPTKLVGRDFELETAITQHNHRSKPRDAEMI